MKYIYTITCIFLCICELLSAQEPKVNFYLNDGSSKQYNISDIENIGFINSSNICTMKIFYQDSLESSFVTKSIESIGFETDSQNIQFLTISISGEVKSYKLSEVDSINFTIQEQVLNPQITSINPVAANIGEALTISGTNFGNTQETSIISFKGKDVNTSTKWSDTLIKLNVPQGAISGAVFVTVGGKKSNEVDFTVITQNGAPVIQSLSQVKGIVGDTVTVTGKNFGAIKDANFVLVNGIKAQTVSWRDSSIKIIITKDITSGKVSVNVKGLKSNEVDFKVLPFISKLDPDFAAVGDNVLIYGTSFGKNRNASTVSINDLKISDYHIWRDTLIEITLPSGLQSGKLILNVNGELSNEVNFTVKQKLVSIFPVSGATGDTVTLVGTNFGNSQDTNKVYFNEKLAQGIMDWQDTLIHCLVPVGATSGDITVKIGNRISNGIKFSLIPKILPITPYSNYLDSAITINGLNFGDSQGIGFVTFSGKKVSDNLVWSNTQIKLSVPNSASSGKVVVSTGNNVESNSVDFTVLPSITSISPNAGLPNDIVTINGISFGNSQGESTVSFNGKQATVQNWGDNQIKVTVPQAVSTGFLSVTVNQIQSNKIIFTLKPQISSINPTSGSVGSQVTINGSNFGDPRGSNVVNFNGITATSYTIWNDNQIVVKVPSGASTGDVVVNVNGNSSNGINFIVNASAIDSITIGTQTWMLKNMDVTTYRNGDAIPEVTDQTEWANATTGAWCYYNNDASNNDTYGKLYNWYAVNDTRGLAPTGWHVPSHDEFTTLVNYLGGSSVAGGKLKETGTTYWNSPNTGATNESGFSAFGGGGRTSAAFLGIMNNGVFWSSTVSDNPASSWMLNLSYTLTGATISWNSKERGFSVRCVKD